MFVIIANISTEQLWVGVRILITTWWKLFYLYAVNRIDIVFLFGFKTSVERHNWLSIVYKWNLPADNRKSNRNLRRYCNSQGVNILTEFYTSSDIDWPSFNLDCFYLSACLRPLRSITSFKPLIMTPKYEKSKCTLCNTYASEISIPNGYLMNDSHLKIINHDENNIFFYNIVFINESVFSNSEACAFSVNTFWNKF